MVKEQNILEIKKYMMENLKNISNMILIVYLLNEKKYYEGDLKAFHMEKEQFFLKIEIKNMKDILKKEKEMVEEFYIIKMEINFMKDNLNKIYYLVNVYFMIKKEIK